MSRMSRAYSEVDTILNLVGDKYLDKMLQAEVISMTIPDKPTSRNQKYKLV